ncbi:hypothetical protein AGMMS49545_06110 [Betaproteobacteria bacterium]|nr:hypothetical protein AGMMS49545_06110 [Betaproteobacteria bacterium]
MLTSGGFGETALPEASLTEGDGDKADGGSGMMFKNKFKPAGGDAGVPKHPQGASSSRTPCGFR